VEGSFVVGEVAGDAPVLNRSGETTAEAGTHEEVGNAGGESGEEFAEATPEQLSASESGEEGAFSDLEGWAGGTEAGEEGGASVESDLREVGEALEGGQESSQAEFFPILAALVPTLISAIGPTVAKGVVSRLSPRATRLLKRIPKRAIGTVIKGAAAGRGNSNLLSLIAKLLETAQESPAQAGGESGMEVEESFLQEAASALESIIGIDTRRQYTNTTDLPWRRICALRIQFPSGAAYRGTGFFIGPRAVATAGHCVYMHKEGGWARKVEVIPGANGSSRPFGQAVSTTFRSVGGWVNGKKPESDYGCIFLPAGAFAQNLGSFGFGAFDAPAILAKQAVLAGYPGDKPFGELWGDGRKIKTVTAKTLVYEIDTMGGQSGAPVYIKRRGQNGGPIQRFVVGIHNYGSTSGNSATRVTAAVGERLQGWSKIGQGSF